MDEQEQMRTEQGPPDQTTVDLLTGRLERLIAEWRHHQRQAAPRENGQES